MLPRINMAIALGEEQRAPKPLTSGLRKLRKEIQDGLDETRNLAVHGIGFVDRDGNYAGTDIHRGKKARERNDFGPEEMESASQRLQALGEEFLPLSLRFQAAVIDRKKLEGEVIALGISEIKRQKKIQQRDEPLS